MQGSTRNENRKIIGLILLAFIVSRFCFYCIYVIKFRSFSIIDCINKYNTFDAGWYAAYVRWIDTGIPTVDLESGQACWAFFPLMPMIVLLLSKLLGGYSGYAVIGSVFSSICFIVSEYLSYKYIQMTRNSFRLAQYFILLASFGVYSFYLSIFYTEALFLMLLVVCFIFLRKKQYLCMGICGAFLSATRNIGIMFVFVVLISRIKEYRSIKASTEKNNFILYLMKDSNLVFGTMLIPMGLFSYMFVLYKKLGDGFAFINVQKAWDKSFCSMMRTFYHDLLLKFPPGYLATMLVLIILSIAYVLYKKKNYDEMIYPVIVLLLSASTSLAGIPRYMIGTFTFPLGVTEQIFDKSRPFKIICFLIAASIEMMFLWMWLDSEGALC